MGGKNWSEDDEIYIEHYIFGEGADKEMTYEAAANFLGRSQNAIRKKVVRMRKEGSEIGYINRIYTEAEKHFIKQNYQNMTANNIGKRLGRPPRSIIYKAQKMGLKKNRSLKNNVKRIKELSKSGYTDYQIGKILGVHCQSVTYHRDKNNW